MKSCAFDSLSIRRHAAHIVQCPCVSSCPVCYFMRIETNDGRQQAPVCCDVYALTLTAQTMLESAGRIAEKLQVRSYSHFLTNKETEQTTIKKSTEVLNKHPGKADLNLDQQ